MTETDSIISHEETRTHSRMRRSSTASTISHHPFDFSTISDALDEYANSTSGFESDRSSITSNASTVLSDDEMTDGSRFEPTPVLVKRPVQKTTNFFDLPYDLQRLVFKFLTPSQANEVRSVCKFFHTFVFKASLRTLRPSYSHEAPDAQIKIDGEWYRNYLQVIDWKLMRDVKTDMVIVTDSLKKLRHTLKGLVLLNPPANGLNWGYAHLEDNTHHLPALVELDIYDPYLDVDLMHHLDGLFPPHQVNVSLHTNLDTFVNGLHWAAKLPIADVLTLNVSVDNPATNRINIGLDNCAWSGRLRRFQLNLIHTHNQTVNIGVPMAWPDDMLLSEWHVNVTSPMGKVSINPRPGNYTVPKFTDHFYGPAVTLSAETFRSWGRHLTSVVFRQISGLAYHTDSPNPRIVQTELVSATFTDPQWKWERLQPEERTQLMRVIRSYFPKLKQLIWLDYSIDIEGYPIQVTPRIKKEKRVVN